MAGVTVGGTIGITGGTVATADGQVSLTFPAGAWPTPFSVGITQNAVGSSVPGLTDPVFPVASFSLSATDSTGQPVTSAFLQPVQVAVQLSPDHFARAAAPLGALYWYDPTQQRYTPVASAFDPTRYTLTAALTHFSDYLATVNSSVAILPTVDGFQTDLCHGTATVSIPLKVPPGPHGFQPSLTLTYTSGSPQGVVSEDHATYERSQGSWVGFGWELDVGYVMMAHFMASDQRCYLVLNNKSYDLIYDTVKGDGTYYTQNNEFLWIKNVTYTDTGGTYWNYFLVRAKDGTEYRFGYEPGYRTGLNFYSSNPVGSRLDGSWGDPNNNGNWLPVRYNLDRITDTHGNLITISYASQSATHQYNNGTCTFDRWVYPTQIAYSSGDTTSQRQINFNLATTRTDLPPSTVANYEYAYLDSIDERAGGTLVRKYVFAYAYQSYSSTTYPNDVKAQDLVLTGITECDGGATAGVVNGQLSGKYLPSTTFQYAVKTGWVGDGSPAKYCPVPLLTQVSNGYGGVVQYAYATAQRYRDNASVGQAQTQWWPVSSKTVQDGQGNSYITNYAYSVSSGAQNEPTAAWTNKFSSVTTYPSWRGFNVATVTEPTGHVHEHRFLRGLDDGTNTYIVKRSDNTSFVDSEWLKGLEYEIRYQEPSGGPIKGTDWTAWSTPTITTYTPGGLTNDHEDWNVYVFWKASFQRNRDTSYLLQTFNCDPAYQNGTQYGNVTDIREYDTNTSNWARHTKRWYYPGNNTANFNPATAPGNDQYVVDHPAAENVYSPGSGDGVLQYSTWYCYDGSYSFATPVGSGTNGGDTSYRGRLTAVWRWYSATGQYLDTGYTYDTYGNRLTETRYNSWGTSTALATGDPRTTTTAYDTPYNTFPSTVTNAKSQVTTYAYDPTLPGLGKVKTVTDPNNVVTTYQYDSFGRVTAVWAPGDDSTQQGAATVLVSYQAGGGQPYRVQVGRRKDVGGSLFAKRAYEWRFYDGLGRLIQTQADFDRTGMAIHAQDVNEIRQGILNDGGSTGVGAVTAGASLIHASDFTGLQSSIQTLWGQVATGVGPSGQVITNLGAFPQWSGGAAQWSSGVTPNGGSGKTPIYGSDVADLRSWLNLYEQAKPRSLTGFTYVAGNASGNVLVSNRFYDGRGLLQYESVPHKQALKVPGQFASGDWSYSANPYTSYTYDSLKRPLTRKQPDTTSTFAWSYGGFTTTTVDENNHQKSSTTDALGRLASVKEYTGANPYTLLNTTSYGYDLQDRLTSVTDQAGNATAIAYDSLGRKLSLSDPDLGLGPNKWVYAYPGDSGAPAISANNQLWLVAKQTDAKVQAITYQYDKLDRMTGKSGTNLAVTYNYDETTVSNGKGRRTSMVDGAGTVTYNYDQRGRLVTLLRTINGSSYQLSTTYDAMDRVLSLTYPNNDVLSYVYGDHGMPVSALLNGVPLVSGATYNALKKVTGLPLGNGLATTWQYYGTGLDYQVAGSPNKWFGLPYQVQTGSLQSQTFSPSGAYDLVGNPTAISYGDHTSEALTFSYNELDQITGMSGNPGPSEGYGNYQQTLTVPPYGNYDIGNLLSRGGTGLSYPYGGQARPHAPTGAGAVNYTYDANGNRWTDGTYTYAYDVENHLTSLTAGSAVLQNNFDGDGLRLARVAGGTTTHYVGDWYENNVTTTTPTFYYPFNGQPIAMKQGSTLYYLHRDQVGSVVSVSNSSGTEVGSARYWPFGGLRATTGTLPTDRLFTGQVRDLGDDRFYFFKARYYDATIGRFGQPDNATADPNRPLSLNRYAYADNNPIKHRDSSGHYTELPTEMVTPGIMITTPPPPTNPLVITVAPPVLPTGLTITTGQLVGPTINITTQPDLNLDQPLINVQSDQGTLIFKADRAKLRTNLRGKPDDGMAAHHIIPVELEQNALVQRAIRGGWDIDGKKNGILLPETPELAEEKQLPQHRGRHREYNEAMRTLLGDLSDLAREYDLTDRKVAKMLNRVTVILKDIISDWDPSLVIR